MNDRDEPSHAREWRWPVGFEINVNSRHPVMRDVLALERLHFILLVLSETVLVLVLDWKQMSEPIFDHERLDVYRLAIEYVATSYRLAKSLNGPERHARDQWLRAS